MSAAQVRARYVTLLSLRWAPVGLLIPVLVLLPLERGISLLQIGSAVAVQGFVVLLLELPTGGLADALGRRPVLLVAGAVNLVALSLFAVAGTFWLLAASYLLQGVYRALDSGPLQSWFVDRSLAADPGADIESGLSRGEVACSLAIGGAALASGGLVWLGPVGLGSLGQVSALTVPVLVALALSLLSTVAVALIMAEDRPARGKAALGASLRGVPVAIGGALALARRSRVVQALIAVEFLWSFGMVTFEKLMPVRLSEVTAAAGPLIGPVNAIAWAASAAGAALVPLLVRSAGARWAGFTLCLAQGVMIVGMGLFAGPAGVIGAFLLCYAVHGAANPVHSGLLHRQATGEYRTSLLSLNSMVAAPGFSIGAIVLTAVAVRTSTTTAIVAGAVVLAAAAPLYLVKSPAVFREPAPSGTSESLAL
ncbi:hypothetical protein Aph02nite_87100 [Actinoplanes philippinensis]|uniref:Major Facilitator Superfamily protein n=1 Tax=Actinoplanes philippinensis TaxID=35752 RepID=A0A1I2F4T3_9ACTN|nr:MFS transporter [Actinoplanes philippinensis]GIE82760.1 hypothetical protein Aph02nite_87100 [Actinoplanes philippinensis]SFE99530.1 Major Facilitator Superfamily protein [Actinoplanes philippinensis]